MNILLDKCLTLLLGWLKLPVSAFWQLFTSSDRSTGASAVLLPILLGIVCVAGILADIAVRIMSRRRHRHSSAPVSQETKPQQETRPEYQQAEYPQPEPQQPVFQQPVYQPAENYPLPDDELQYAAYRRPEQEMGNTMEYKYVSSLSRNAGNTSLGMDMPVFDEAPVRWEDAPLQPAPQSEAAAPVRQDVHYQFARPLPPEEPAPVQQAPIRTSAAESIHPGLDDDSLRSNLNMDQPNRAAEWKPFAGTQYTAPEKGLSRLARRARQFVSLEDGESSLSLKDYKPHINPTDAFHAPVYPNRTPQDGDY